jgi:hypothetical protein
LIRGDNKMGEINAKAICAIAKLYGKDIEENNIYEELKKYGIFAVVRERGYCIDAFKDLFNYLPDSLKYRLFIEAYKSSDYGFRRLRYNYILDEIKRLLPKRVIEVLKKKADGDNCIVIYRGESTESTHVHKALSWTLKYDKAVWFAKRFNFTKQGIVYTARININNVIAYIGDGEKEIIVRHKDLIIIKKEAVAIE